MKDLPYPNPGHLRPDVTIASLKRTGISIRLLLISGLCGWCVAFNPLPLLGAPAPAGAQGVIEFSNGDRLHGQVVSVDAKNEVRLSNPAIKELMECTTADISEILLAHHEAAQSNAPARYMVRFINDDELTGNVASLDGEQLVLDTWYAGSLRFPRRNIQSIRLLQSDQIIYQGPTGLDGWTVSDTKADDNVADEPWKYRDGVFYAKEAGAIARDVKLPDSASIDLDVAWRDFLQLTITLYTESLRVYQLTRNVQGANGVVLNVPAGPQEGGGFYALQLNRNTVYLLTVRKDGQWVNSPLDMLPGLELKNKVRLGIRVNKEQKTISLLVDGVFVKTWKEPDDFAGQGTAVRFVQQGQALVNLSNIKIAKWDGAMEVPAAPTPALTKDFVQLRNDDNLSGKLEGVRNGMLSFTTSFGTLEIPVERISYIQLPVDPKGKPARDPGFVRARFAGRGAVTFRLEQWSDQQVTASSPNFGKATFNVAAFESIIFKPQNQPSN